MCSTIWILPIETKILYSAIDAVCQRHILVKFLKNVYKFEKFETFYFPKIGSDHFYVDQHLSQVWQQASHIRHLCMYSWTLLSLKLKSNQFMERISKGKPQAKICPKISNPIIPIIKFQNFHQIPHPEIPKCLVRSFFEFR